MSLFPTVHFLVNGGLFLYNLGRKEAPAMNLDDDLFPINDDLFPNEESEGDDV